MTEKPVGEISASSDAVQQTYQMAVNAFSDWQSSFTTHGKMQQQYEQALAAHEANPEITMPEEFEGIENVAMLAQMNANRRAYLEGRFEGICNALTAIGGGDPMEWNVRIQNDYATK